MPASHMLYIAHSHDPDCDDCEFWMTEAEATRFYTQLAMPKSPFVFFTDADGAYHCYALADIRYSMMRKIGPEANENTPGPRKSGEVISFKTREVLNDA
jgi:hypothetical protein